MRKLLLIILFLLFTLNLQARVDDYTPDTDERSDEHCQEVTTDTEKFLWKKPRPDGCRWNEEKGWFRDDDVKPHTTPTTKDMAPLVTFNSEDAKKRWRATCKEYGFKNETEEMGKCILRIQELEFEQMKLQIQINTANQQSIKETRAEQRAASQQRAFKLQQEKILKEKNYTEGLMLLQQSFGILNSLNPPKTTCTFNDLMNNMVCR